MQDQCSHGIAWDAHCPHCALLWHQTQYRYHVKQAEEYALLVERAKRDIAELNPAAPQALQP